MARVVRLSSDVLKPSRRSLKNVHAAPKRGVAARNINSGHNTPAAVHNLDTSNNIAIRRRP